MRAALPFLLALAALLAPGVVDAGGGTGGASCNCAGSGSGSSGSGGSGGASGSAPTSHTVTVPGVYVVPPSVYVAPSRLIGGVSGVGGGVSGASGEAAFSGDISVSVQAGASAYSSATSAASALASAASNSSASTGATAVSSALGTANSQAANLLAASGGSGSFSESVGGNIPNLVVATPGAPAAAPVCARYASAVQAVAIQAVCLDDKDVPHPASQVMPGAAVPEGYAGELFRCIAGAHMQYVTAPYGGEARFDHGQTVVCRKGEALWRDAGGRVQCRPQTPARDCNERSLLRRYGAGIKILQAAVSGQCVEWRGNGGGAGTSQGSLQLDGGVGG